MDVRTGHLPENHADEDVDAVKEGGRRSRCDEGVHVGTAVDRRAETVGEVGIVDNDDGNCEDKLDGGVADGVMVRRKECGEGKAGHMSHGDIHHKDGKDGGRDETLYHGGVLFRIILVGVLLFDPFPGGISGVRDGFAEKLVGDSGFIEFDGHGVGHKADGDVFHAGNGRDRTFHGRLARRARHSVYFEFSRCHNVFLSEVC